MKFDFFLMNTLNNLQNGSTKINLFIYIILWVSIHLKKTKI